MVNALHHQDAPMQAEAFPFGTEAAALRLVLEQVRELAAQSRLIAMNAAFESAADCREAAGRDMEALGSSAGRTVTEMERMVASVELLLRQIESPSAPATPL